MAQRKHRLHINRTMIKTGSVTMMLKIVARQCISFYIRQLVQHDKKETTIEVLGALTLRQLDQLIRKLKLRLARFQNPHQHLEAVRSISLVVASQGDCVVLSMTFVNPESGTGPITMNIQTKQLARFITNLERERAFATTETRKNMADD